ncbi:MAG: multidrug effflux MFS transporter, partial [Oscillochloris sp.]|nr:multidrug effflux MFS transporter [Oscillochloris sp.]
MTRSEVTPALPAARPLGLILIIGALSAFGPLSIDMYLPGLPALSGDLHGPAWQVQLTLSACLLGLAGGQVLAGPLSDSLGRRRPLLIGLLVYALASALCALAPSVPALVALRFLQGVAGAAGIVIARAIVRDHYRGAEVARFFAMTMMISGMAPIMAPVFGGLLLKLTSWRGIFVVLTVMGLALLAAAAFGLAESLPPDRRRVGGLRATVAAFRMLLSDRSFVGYALASGLAFAAMFAYISGSPFVLQQIYAVSPQVFSLIFAVNAIGIVVANQISARLVSRIDPRRLMGLGIGVSLLGGLLLVAAVQSGAGLLGVIPAFFLAVASIGLIGPNATALALAEQPQDVLGSASG